jgi:hypothetical protein
MKGGEGNMGTWFKKNGMDWYCDVRKGALCMIMMLMSLFCLWICRYVTSYLVVVCLFVDKCVYQ